MFQSKSQKVKFSKYDNHDNQVKSVAFRNDQEVQRHPLQSKIWKKKKTKTKNI